jgi:hypothetical protein
MKKGSRHAAPRGVRAANALLRGQLTDRRKIMPTLRTLADEGDQSVPVAI